MIHIIITYSVKEKWSEYNKQLIEGFIQQLRDYSIRGVSHFVYKVGASTFIHICRYASISVREKAADMPAFKDFLSKLESILDKEPIAHAVEEIGHYPE
jgi:hypothetical protein